MLVVFLFSRATAEVELVCADGHVNCCNTIDRGVGNLVVAEVNADYRVFVFVLVDYDVAELEVRLLNFFECSHHFLGVAFVIDAIDVFEDAGYEADAVGADILFSLAGVERRA